jgi:hypothetical protein
MDVRWLFAGVALAAAVVVARELPAVLRRRRRWRQISELEPLSVRAVLALPDHPSPGELVVVGRPLSPPLAEGAFDFDLQDPTEPGSRVEVITSEAPLVEYPGPDEDLLADQAGDALHGGSLAAAAALYVVGVARQRPPGGTTAGDPAAAGTEVADAAREAGAPDQAGPAESGGGAADSLGAEGTPSVTLARPSGPPWRLEPTLGPDGRLELIAFRDPGVPARQAQRALLALWAGTLCLGFAVYFTLRLFLALILGD